MSIFYKTNTNKILRFVLGVLLLICVSLWIKFYVELLNAPQSYLFICSPGEMGVTFILLFIASVFCFLFLLRPPKNTLSFVWGIVFFLFLFIMLSDAVSFFYAPLYYKYDGSRLYDFWGWFFSDLRGFGLCILGVVLLYYKPKSAKRMYCAWVIFILLVLANLPWEYVGFR